ncbi:MAG: glycogen-binding domain-containing protein [Treponema sp.]|jgi:hypothetical protein|nr:glycogen-binding domain-containing protein [Treponema sp.]
MKTITAALLLFIIIGTIGAADIESYQFIDHLLNLSGPGKPDVYEDKVIFTASSYYRRVGIAFAHEGFARVYWFEKLLIPRNDETPPESQNNKRVDPYRDSGLLFFIYDRPENMQELRYRMVIDGLWTTDPLNPLRITDPATGLTHSLVSVSSQAPSPATGLAGSPPGTLQVSYTAPPGERITLAGSFNGWDPFMYELRETKPGFYSLTLLLPPGVYQYVLFYRGERILDPNNLNRVYTREGQTANEWVIR